MVWHMHWSWWQPASLSAQWCPVPFMNQRLRHCAGNHLGGTIHEFPHLGVDVFAVGVDKTNRQVGTDLVLQDRHQVTLGDVLGHDR